MRKIIALFLCLCLPVIAADNELAGPKYRDSVNPNQVNLRSTDSSGITTPHTAISALTDAGNVKDIAATQEGHLEVAIHSPRLPFGSIHAERLTPVFQSDGVYGINPFLMTTTTGLSLGTGSGSGSVTSADNLIVVGTGETQFSFATVQSRRRLKYRAGQGVLSRFTSVFSEPAASSILVSGIGTAESGFYFGYNGTSFGILHTKGGVRELHTMTITTGSTATNVYVITLPNSDTVNVTASDTSGSTTQTAYEISKGTFPGWSAEAIGSTVVFLAGSAGDRTNTFTLAQTGAGAPAVGSDVETRAGVSSTDTWYPQTSWNGDRLDGSGDSNNQSGATLDQQAGNVYQIGVQYLGFGSVTFEIEVASFDSNNPEWVTVHTLRFPNTLTTPHTSQPSFPFTAAAYSAGSTTDVSVSVGSFAGFIEGEIHNIGPRSSYNIISGITSSTSSYTPLFTVRNGLTFASRANQSVTRVLDVSGAAKSNTGLTTFLLIRNATLTGPVNFTQFDSTQSSSLVDKAATGCSFANNSQVIWSGTVSESGSVDHIFGDKEITVQPGESITLAVRSVTATATCVGTVNVREDQ